MILIISIALLALLKFLEVGFLADFSWWWIAGLMAVGFIWFEFVEPTLGLDKRRAHDESEAIRKERVRKAFEQQTRSKRR